MLSANYTSSFDAQRGPKCALDKVCFEIFCKYNQTSIEKRGPLKIQVRILGKTNLKLFPGEIFPGKTSSSLIDKIRITFEGRVSQTRYTSALPQYDTILSVIWLPGVPFSSFFEPLSSFGRFYSYFFELRASYFTRELLYFFKIFFRENLWLGLLEFITYVHVIQIFSQNEGVKRNVYSACSLPR